jgi:hypothetical protein
MIANIEIEVKSGGQENGTNESEYHN